MTEREPYTLRIYLSENGQSRIAMSIPKPMSCVGKTCRSRLVSFLRRFLTVSKPQPPQKSVRQSWSRLLVMMVSLRSGNPRLFQNRYSPTGTRTTRQNRIMWKTGRTTLPLNLLFTHSYQVPIMLMRVYTLINGEN